ncbi:MAG: hypothetical protein E7080_09680 [Bacteroidales bacterium]|nr:hypothetical protein [Bacteroidales bacterium]
MSTISLPGIFKIGFLECSKLSSHLALKSIAGVPIAILTEITDIIFSGEPTCEAVSDNDNNGRSEKTTLKFTTTQKIPDDRPLAFVVQCVNGRKSLIGAKERPYPIVKITTATGTASGNISAYSVEITHSAIKSLLSVAV